MSWRHLFCDSSVDQEWAQGAHQQKFRGGASDIAKMNRTFASLMECEWPNRKALELPETPPLGMSFPLQWKRVAASFHRRELWLKRSNRPYRTPQSKSRYLHSQYQPKWAVYPDKLARRFRHNSERDDCPAFWEAVICWWWIAAFVPRKLDFCVCSDLSSMRIDDDAWSQ